MSGENTPEIDADSDASQISDEFGLLETFPHKPYAPKPSATSPKALIDDYLHARTAFTAQQLGHLEVRAAEVAKKRQVDPTGYMPHHRFPEENDYEVAIRHQKRLWSIEGELQQGNYANALLRLQTILA